MNANLFADPKTFDDLADAVFSNTASTVTQFSDAQGQGLRITQGSGTVNFSTSAVPEPGTYAMLLAGLGLIGFVAGRRSLGRRGR